MVTFIIITTIIITMNDIINITTIINYHKYGGPQVYQFSVKCHPHLIRTVVNQSKSTLNEVFLYTDIFITWLKPGDTYIHTNKDTIMVTNCATRYYSSVSYSLWVILTSNYMINIVLASS